MRRDTENDAKMRRKMVKRASSGQVKEDLLNMKRKGRRLKKEGWKEEV